jgi:amidase
MKLSEYLDQDAVGLAELVTSGEIAPDEPARCALQAIELFDPHVQALVELYPDRVNAEYLETLPGGPLRGVPMLFKDLICHEAGQKLEAGSRLAEGLTVPTSTDLADRFQAAGLLNLGRTKSPEMGFNTTTESVAHGPVHNPWKMGVSAGGSSGGAAAAVASGMVPVAHANDGGGSIRIPAAACGIIGLKPTRGRVPIGPDAAEGLNGLGIELAVTRTVRDMAAVLDAVEGPGVGDPYEIARPNEPYADLIRRDPGRLRIAVWRDLATETRATEEVLEELDKTVQTCRALGHEIIEIGRLDLGVSWDSFVEANAKVWCANMAHWVMDLAKLMDRPINEDTLEHTTLACVEYGRQQGAVSFLEAFDVFNLVSRRIGRTFEECDIILSPTLPRPPVPHGVFNANEAGLSGLEWTAKIFDGTIYTALFNVTGLPAISLPLGWSDSLALPIGMQFGAGFGREDRLLALAAQLERAGAWTIRIPPRLATLID